MSYNCTFRRQTTVQFSYQKSWDACAFAGYTHRRTLGFKEGQSHALNEEIEGRSKTYVFRLNLPRGLKSNVIHRV